MKRFIFCIIATFAAWTGIDYVLHNIILMPYYQMTAYLWLPPAEMNLGLLYAVTLVVAGIFSAIYYYLVNPKSGSQAMCYGLLWGLAMGISMGYGSYSVMPIPQQLAFFWFLGCLVEGAVGGALLGLFIRPAAKGV